MITFSIVARNDNYMPDFLYRINTTINYLCKEIYDIKKSDEFEIIIVDWASKSPLHETIDLDTEYKDIVSFIYVSENDLKDSPFDSKNIASSYAHNLAIRRASGKYIFTTSADTFLNANSLLALYNICSEKISTTFNSDKAYLTIGRKHIPWEIITHQPSRSFLKNYLERKGHELRNDYRYLKWGGGAGFIGMHRDIWELNQGLDEGQLYYGGNDVEIFLKTINYYEHIELSNLGICSFHMEHPPELRTSNSKYNGKNYDYFTSNRRDNNNWGQANKKFELIKAKGIFFKSLEGDSFRKITLHEDIYCEKKLKKLSEIKDLFENLSLSKKDIYEIMCIDKLIKKFDPGMVILQNINKDILILIYICYYFKSKEILLITKRFSKIFGRISSNIILNYDFSKHVGILNCITNDSYKFYLKEIPELLIVLGSKRKRKMLIQNLKDSHWKVIYYFPFNPQLGVKKDKIDVVDTSTLSESLSSFKSGILLLSKRNILI